ncbi:MAG: L-aspartate oxidase [Spirochaetes bacterium]|jgi:L-aspartate oxidase|nr:L-aspartate oxidase [Spirochaetota bacterium]
MKSYEHKSDYLVVGTGIAGLSFAIHAAAYGTVTIVTKKKNYVSNTNYAQGGIASVLSSNDSVELHIEDTFKAGVTHCNPEAVNILVKNGPERINELISWGVNFSFEEDEKGNRQLELGREGGHSKNRIVHAKDYTGQEVERALIDKISSIDAITFFEDYTAIDLLTEHQLGQDKDSGIRTCYGAYVLENETGDVHTFLSHNTLIASGGVGSVYLHTTNPYIATGDGIAMAFRAGAEIADMEFMQFHPTSFYDRNDRTGIALLVSEAVRGEGAVLINHQGERFMKGVHELEELAPRDIVARAIDKELKKSGKECVFLDISFKESSFIKERFPNIFKGCLERGIDITKEPIPVVPAAHYLCGGVVTDLYGRTSIKNLYASGESACTGVHGANRLASNSLLEALVFSYRAAEHSKTAKSDRKNELPEFPRWNKEGTFDLEEWVLIQHNVEEIQRTMWDYVGIVRSNLRLERALRRINFLEEEIIDYYKRRRVWRRLVELRNLVTIARLIINGATTRKESRGLHYNTDYPELDDNYAKAIFQNNLGKIELKKVENVDFEQDLK